MSVAKNGMPVIAFSQTRVMGGFIVDLCAIATFKQHFPAKTNLTFLSGDGAPWKHTLMELCPHLDNAFHTPLAKVSMNLLSKKGYKGALKRGAIDPALDEAVRHGLHTSWFILTPNIRGSAYLNLPPTRFQVPEARQAGLKERLQSLGADPNRFMVTFHAREASYKGDVDSARNVDPRVYLEAMRHVVSLGGQAVRLGDPTMTRLPPVDGVIDLTEESDNLMLTAYAMSQSRFAVCTNSSNLHLATAFRIPLLATDAITEAVFPLYPEHLVLTKEYTAADGKVLRQQALKDSGLMYFEDPPEGYTVRDCTAAEINLGIDGMMQLTPGVDRWREPQPEPLHTPRADTFDLIMRSGRQWEHAYFVDLSPLEAGAGSAL